MDTTCRRSSRPSHVVYYHADCSMHRLLTAAVSWSVMWLAVLKNCTAVASTRRCPTGCLPCLVTSRLAVLQPYVITFGCLRPLTTALWPYTCECCGTLNTALDTRLNYPAPGRGTGYNCFRAISFFVCFFVSLSATLRENGWTDLHEIFREGVEWPWDDLITFWVNSGKRVGGQRSICLLSKLLPVELDISFALAWWQHFLSMAADKSNKSISFARWQQGAGFVVPRTTACSHFIH